MKDKKLFIKLLCTFSILITIFVGIGTSSYIVNKLNTSNKISSSNNVVNDGETVTLNFKYAVCESIEKTEYEKVEIKNGTTTTQANFNSFFTYINSITKNGPASGSTIPTGTYSYYGIGDYDEKTIFLNVFTQIEYQKSACSSDKWTGEYTIYAQQLCLVSSSYNYYGNAIKDKIEVKKDILLTASEISSLLSLTEYSNYSFVGLAKENDDGTPSDTTISLPLKVSTSQTYYAVFNQTSITGTTKYKLGQTISSYTEQNEYTFNAIMAKNEFNLTNDISYFEKDNVVFLGDSTSTIVTSKGDTVIGTKISSGVTINFGLNNGIVTITGKSGTVNDLEPEDSAHANQYTICLQSDLYVYGTLVVGANYGTLNNTYYEGHIANEYVTLDLNGHNIYLENGTLNVYGLIKNSKETGEIISYGGYIYTLAVIYDYRGGNATSSLVNSKIMPFQIYSLPYFRCKTRMYYSDNGWTKFIARCQAQTTSYSQSEVLINFIGGENDTVLFKLSNVQDSYVIIEGTENKQVTNGTTTGSDEVKFCLSRRLNITFINCSACMSNIVINPGTKVDTKDYNFPVSSFFDILLTNTDLTFSQSLKMMPGMSFIADKDSNIILSYDSTNKKSAQISVLGENAYYYDFEKETFIKNDLIAENQLTFTSSFFKSVNLWKYYSGSRFKIYGTLVFQGGNANVREYLLAGQMDFNKVAYSSDGTTNNLEYINYSENENPFAKLMKKHSDIKILTYGYDYLLGSSDMKAVIKGYSRPLVSYGKGYYTNGSATDAKVGEYSFRTGIFKVSDTEMYYFNIGEKFTLNDNSTCTLEPCTYDDTEHTFTDTKTNTKYAYFASSYYPYTNTDGTITLNVTRSNSSTTSVTVTYNSTLERWLRK